MMKGCKAGLEFKLPQGNEKTMDPEEVGQKVCDTSLICQMILHKFLHNTHGQ